MIILDTDVFSSLELPDSTEYGRLRARIAQLDPPEPVATAIITYEEAITLAHNALLLSRNLRDFRRIPQLRVEDWSKP
jgi:predicted nucleic acid-binding protein